VLKLVRWMMRVAGILLEDGEEEMEV